MPPASERRRRLREAALQGARGRDWYDRAEREIRTVARSWGADPSAVAVAVAATSPATPVISSPRMARGGGGGSNIGKARRVVKAWNAGHSAMDVIHPKSPGASLLRTYEACERPASAHPGTPARCARDAFPSPEDTKTHAFVRNLLGDPDAVTVDRIVGRGAGIPLGKSGEPTISKVRYRLVAGDIRAVARELGWQPREVMAAAWTHWGGSGDLNLATTRERARSLRKRANGRRRGSMRRRNKRKHVGMLRGGLPRPSKPHGHKRTRSLARRGKPVTDVSASYLRFYGVPVPAGFTTGTAEHKKMRAKPKAPRWLRERYGQRELKLTPRNNTAKRETWSTWGMHDEAERKHRRADGLRDGRAGRQKSRHYVGDLWYEEGWAQGMREYAKRQKPRDNGRTGRERKRTRRARRPRRSGGRR